MTSPSRSRDARTSPTRRSGWPSSPLGLLLPAFALLGDDLDGGAVSGVLIATGSILLSILVLGRMAGLLSVVRAQAVQLAALARSDGLTGLPNRRTLDYELSRACQAARLNDTPLTVAIIDLDHFKKYNDTFGHPAGDLLLREATAAWADILDDDEILARYGGEEFVVLFPGQIRNPGSGPRARPAQSHPPRTDLLGGRRHLGPGDRSRARCCLVPTSPCTTRRARAATGCAWPSRTTPQAHAVRLEIALQPIVDLATREPIAVEALSRFPDGDPATVFAAARHDGTWMDLEAAAITAALAVRPPGLMLSINVSLDGLGTPPVRDALSGDLTGVILEITENTDIAPTPWLTDEVQGLRDRGAIIAVDDWGKGFSNLDRVLMLRPEIVKIDMSLVHNLDLDYHRAAIQMVCAWADLVGARICAEGVETEDQWRQLQAIGVHLGQGWFFGAPAAPGTAPHLQAGTPVGA